MHITLESDYAVRIVHCLAQNGTRLDAASISEKTGVTLRFALKILHRLVGSGIVRSYKGARGGYELARPAEEITLRAVIETVEGPLALSRCLAPDYKGCDPARCRFHGVYREITDLVIERLEAVNFAEL